MGEQGVAIPLLGRNANVKPVSGGPELIRKVLLTCGILSSLLYIAMNALIPMQWEGYSYASRVVSELSAVGAPTRSVWVVLGIAYAVLMAAFGWGVWASAAGNRALRIVGGLLIAYGIFDIVPWPPMHQREVLAVGGGTLSDTLHIVWSFVAVLFMMVAMGFGATAYGKRFRIYTIATILILAGLGVLTGMAKPQIEANLPTPWAGVWERISIAGFLLWVVVLAIGLLRRPSAAASSPPLRICGEGARG
jgi:hypothetical protein